MRGQSLGWQQSSVIRTFCNKPRKEKGSEPSERGAAFNGKSGRNDKVVTKKEDVFLIVGDDGAVSLSGRKLSVTQLRQIARKGTPRNICTSGELTHQELLAALHGIQIRQIEIKGEFFM